MKQVPTLSVVIPVYRSAESLPLLVPRLVEVIRGMGRKPEIILVDDASPDGTWATCKSLKEQYPESLKVARLAVNRGQHNAVLCGFYLCTGEVVVTMDDDLENPPEEVPKLVEAIDAGYDLAVADYRQGDRAQWKQRGSDGVNRLIRFIFHLPPDFQLTSFRAVNGSVVREVARMGQTFPYITAMLLSHSARYTNVPVRHEARAFGHSNYNLRRSVSLGLNLVLNYSSLPLVAVGVFCASAFVVSLLLAFWVVGQALVLGTGVPGWASLMVVTTFFHGVILLSLVIFGTYLIRLHQQLTRTKVRYIISELHE